LQTKYLQEKVKKNKSNLKDEKKSTFLGKEKRSLKNNEKKEKRDIEINFKLIGTESEFKIISYDIISNQKGNKN